MNDISRQPRFAEEFVGFRHTLSRSVAMTGIGLHSGKPVTMVLHPALAGSGIVVERGDLPGAPQIPLIYSNVTGTALGTTAAANGVEVHTVEHLCAALSACGIDDVLIELDAAEIPVADGSAEPFVRMIRRAGRQALNAPRRCLRVLRLVEITLEDKYVALLPDSKPTFEFTVVFQHPQIGMQHKQVVFSRANFCRDIARARTFGFAADAEALQRAGLARGASCDNAVVFDPTSVRNPEGLRYDDECVRHKILDAVGDLALAGAPIIGRYVGHKAGHALNNALLRALFAKPVVRTRTPARRYAPARPPAIEQHAAVVGL